MNHPDLTVLNLKENSIVLKWVNKEYLQYHQYTLINDNDSITGLDKHHFWA